MAKSVFVKKSNNTIINGTLSLENKILMVESEDGNKTELSNLVSDMLDMPLKITFAHSSEEA